MFLICIFKIKGYMACHNIFLSNEKDFYQKMKDRDSDMIIKMVKCVLSAHKRKKISIDIFDVSFKDSSSMVFSMTKSEYFKFLSNCLPDLIKVEEYELCADIHKITTKVPRKRKVQTKQ